MTTYDEWKSTEPEDPYADELELERRDAEMEPDEPEYDASELDDHTCSTSPPRKLHQMDYSGVESKARREDGPEADFWSGLNDEADNINIITGEVEK